MSFRIYNTLTRSVQEVTSLEPGHVRMYTCGPTVYNIAHIGNFRAFMSLKICCAVGFNSRVGASRR